MHKVTTNLGDLSLLARELDAVLRAAEFIEDDQTILLNAATRLSKELLSLTNSIDREGHLVVNQRADSQRGGHGEH